MDDDSFDPRNWNGPAKQKPPSQGDSSGIAAAATNDEAPAPVSAIESRQSELPEAWRAVGTDFVASQPDSKSGKLTQAPAEPANTGGKSSHLALLMSALLLIGGACSAWLTRAAPVVDARQPIAAAAYLPTPGAVERRLTLAGTGDIAGALIAAGVAPEDAKAASQAAAKALTAPGEIRVGVTLLPEGNGFVLAKLQASASDGSGASVIREGAGSYSGTAVAAALTRQIKVLRGELDGDSFYSSAVAAGLLDTMIPDFTNAFAFDFNLASEVAAGDTFEVAYEQTVGAAGEPIGKPRLLFASLTTKAKSLALYRFQSTGGEVGWYDGNGGATKRGFMRTPIDGAHITSKFGMRFHPVLHFTRMHAGVDFAAPIGTPIYAAADGIVTNASPTNCAGNMIMIDHDKGMQTRYFHSRNYAEGLHVGQHVKQGETVGYVGVTGICTTGPHLHYETLVNGEHVDPLSIPVEDSSRKTLDPGLLAAFKRERDRVDLARADQAG